MKVSVQQIINCWFSRLGKECSTQLNRTISKSIKSEKSGTVMTDWLRSLGVKISMQCEGIAIDRPKKKGEFPVSAVEWSNLVYILHDGLKNVDVYPTNHYLVMKEDCQANVEWIGKLLFAFKGAVASYPFAPPTNVGKMFRDYISRQDDQAIRCIATRYSMPREQTRVLLAILMIMFVDKNRTDLLEDVVKQLSTEPYTVIKKKEPQKRKPKTKKKPAKEKAKVKTIRKKKEVVYEIEEPDDFEF